MSNENEFRHIPILAVCLSIVLGILLLVINIFQDSYSWFSVFITYVPLAVANILVAGYGVVALLYALLFRQEVSGAKFAMYLAIIALFVGIWGNIYYTKDSAFMFEGRLILQAVNTPKGFLDKLSIINGVRPVFRRSIRENLSPKRCRSVEEYMGNVPIKEDTGYPVDKVVSMLIGSFNRPMCIKYKK